MVPLARIKPERVELYEAREYRHLEGEGAIVWASHRRFRRLELRFALYLIGGAALLAALWLVMP